LGVDQNGLDAMDRKYLSQIAEFYSGGPVGIETIAASLAEQRDVVEDVIEPYLIQQGYIQRSPRGRILTRKAYEFLGISPPPIG
jgi:Holliday junction DNA helicase RuvB